jgi:tripartite-type tricarboxylate transporter receptor subunit TctC
MLRIPILLMTAVLAAAAASAQEKAGDYPKQPVRVIVTVPAGGGVDAITRVVTDKLTRRFGQPFVVDNRGGQAGNLGAEAVFSAEPDGHTLMASQPAPLTVNGLLYQKLNYDPAAFVPIAIMTTIPNTLTVRADLPVRSAQEFVAYARANPGKLNYASQGTGTTSHLTAELFQSRTGTRMVHVPYKGTAPALNDLVAGHVDLMFTELASAIELHRAGKARILAIAAREPSSQLADVPTLIEAGLADFESGTWNALSAPPRTSPEIVEKLNGAVVDALRDGDVRTHLAALNAQPLATTPVQAAGFIKTERQRWADVIRAAGVASQ